MSAHPKKYFDRVSPTKILCATAVLCFALAGVCLGFDVQISDALRQWDVPGDLAKAIELSEAFAHGSGAAIILLLVYSISVAQRKNVLIAILITLLSGVLANGLKATAVRIRPHVRGVVEVANSPKGIDLRERPAELQIVEPDFWDARQRSFPSGHAATAWGLAIGLTLAFPRGAFGFVLLACLASLQRLTCGAHYPSDVFVGAGLACCVAYAVVTLPAYPQFLLRRAASSSTSEL